MKVITLNDQFAATALDVASGAILSTMGNLDKDSPDFGVLSSKAWKYASKQAGSAPGQFASMPHFWNYMKKVIKKKAPEWLHQENRLVNISFKNRHHIQCGSLDAPVYQQGLCVFHDHYEIFAPREASPLERINFPALFAAANLTWLEELAVLEGVMRPGRRNADAVARGRFADELFEFGNFVVGRPFHSLAADPEHPEIAATPEKWKECPLVGIRFGGGCHPTPEESEAVTEFCSACRSTRQSWEKSGLHKLRACAAAIVSGRQ
jgi:hypothetical protein